MGEVVKIQGHSWEGKVVPTINVEASIEEAYWGGFITQKKLKRHGIESSTALMIWDFLNWRTHSGHQ